MTIVLKKVKHEEIFIRFCHESLKTIEPTEIGRQQFYEYQSVGKQPINPDDYYIKLTSGKTSFDWLVSEHQQGYINRDDRWFGLIPLWIDWEGERYILPHLLKWRKKLTGEDLPSWITSEKLTLDDILKGML